MNKEVIRRLGLALSNLFRPRSDATRAEVRMIGVKGWVFGLVVSMISSATLPLFYNMNVPSSLILMIGLICMCGAGFMVIGSYRILTGNPAECRADSYDTNWGRIIIGIFSLFATFVILGFLMAGILYFLEWIGVDPRTLFNSI